MMLREQKRTESGVMIRGILTLIVMFVKHIFNYEIPNEILDIVFELALTTYGVYTVGNSPRIKGEY